MLNTEQTLPVALAQLRCINPSTAASLSDLYAVRVARDSLDELLASCVEQLRTDPDTSHTWADIADALGLDSSTAARLRFSGPAEPSPIDAFWRLHAGEFKWDFLPIPFLHALYAAWLHAESPDAAPLEPRAFTRRLKTAVAGCGWVYSRSRADHLMQVDEPLVAKAPGWSRSTTRVGQYGLRRTSASVD